MDSGITTRSSAVEPPLCPPAVKILRPAASPAPKRSHRRPAPNASPPGFARIEALALLAALVLLGSIALSALANSKAGSDRMVCLNNLRQIGGAFQRWASDHDGQLPWWVCAAYGGTRLESCPTPSSGVWPPPWLGSQNQAYFQYSWISNELARPALLACPAEDATPAADFSFNPDGGFLNPAYRNQAISYFLGLHARPEYPGSILAGDLNVRTNGPHAGCSTRITTGMLIGSTPAAEPDTEWLPAIHGTNGNLLLYDGRVLTASTADLRTALTRTWKEPVGWHLLFPSR